MPDRDITLSAGLDISDIQDTAENLNEEIRGIFESTSGQDLSKPFQTVLSTLDKLYTKSTNISQKMQELGNKQIPTSEYTEVQKQIDKVNEELVRANNRKHKFLATGGKEGSKTFKSIEYDINQASHKLQYLKDDLQDLVDNGKAFTLGSDTAEYNKLATQLNEVNNASTIAVERFYALEDSEEEVAEHSNRVAFAFGKLVSGLMQATKKAVTFGASLPIKILKSTASLLAKCAKTAAKFVSNAIISKIKKLGSAISGVGKSSNSAEKLLKKGLGMVLRYGIGVRSLYFLFRKIRGAITEGFEEIAQVHEPFNIAISNLMTAFNTLKGSLSAAFAPIVEYVEPILTRFIYLISEVISQIGMLAAALTGKEFVKAVPVQQNYADSLSNTAEKEKEAKQAQQEQQKEMQKQRKEAKKLNKELKKTISSFDDLNILQDNKNDDDDDDAFDFDTGNINIPETPKVDYITQPISDSFKDFADKLKAMFRNADFTDLGKLLGEKLRDALNRIPWDKIKETLRKIAKSIATFLNGFLEVPGLFEAIGRTLAEALNSAFEFLNEFAKDFHFDSLGKAIGNGINSALQSIDWPLIYETFKNWGTGIAQALSNFLQTTDWTLVGETLANALNAAITFLNAFAVDFDWTSLGNAIKDGLLGLLNNIDWPLIYGTMLAYGKGIGTALQTALNNPEMWTAIFTTVTNAFNALVYGLNAFITSINWGELGTNIATGLNNAIESINWAQLTTLLINAINGVFDLWYNFVTTFDFFKFGEHIGTTLSDAVKGINWEEGGASVAETVNALYEALNGFVTSTDWPALGAAAIDAIAGYLGALDWALYGESLSNVAKALLDFLTGAFQEVDWDELPGQITTAIKDFLTNFDWDGTAESVGKLIGAAFTAVVQAGGELINTMLDFGKSIMDGGFQGIIDAIAGIATWIKEHILDPFVEGFKETFGIHSPASTMLEYGKAILDGILQGIINAILGIATWIKEHIFDPFVEGFKEAFGLNGEEPGLVSIGVSVFEGFKTGLTNVMSSIGEWLRTTIVEPFINEVKSLFGLNGEESSLVSIGKDLLEGFKTGIGNVMSTVTDWVGSIIIDPFVNGVKSLFGLDGEESVLVSVGSGLIDGLKNGLLNAVDGISDWISTKITGPITGFFSNLFGISDDGKSSIFSGFGGNLIAGLKDGLTNAISGLEDWIGTNVTGPITGFFKNLFGIGVDGESSIFSGFGGDMIEGLKTGLSNAAANAGTWIESNVTGPITGFFKDLFGIHSPSTVFEGYGGDLMEGLENGVEGSSDLPKNALDTVNGKMKDVFSAVSEILEWASLGSKLMEIGLIVGIISQIPAVTTATQNLESSMRDVFSDKQSAYLASARVLMNEFKSGITSKTSDLTTAIADILSAMQNQIANTSFASVGSQLIDNLKQGVDSATYMLTNTGTDIANAFSWNIQNGANWWQLGADIIQGIYNGVLYNSGKLNALAWNTASEMYYWACKALGVASPSKKFAWIGKMVDEGWSGGIEDNKDTVIDSATNIADDIMDAANKSDPVITLDTQLNNTTQVLADVLDTYSTQIVNSFTDLIATLNRFADLPNSLAISQGRIVPTSALNSSSSAYSQTDRQLEELSGKLDTLIDTRITQSDIIDIVRRYLSWSIGDEQIARHANAGNAKLDRRLHPVRGGA